MKIFNKIELPENLPDRRGGPFARAEGRAFDYHAMSADITQIDIYDEIGEWGVSARDFKSVLAGIHTPKIIVSINSPGGDVFDGIAMYNDLRDHAAEVTTRVTGVAASAASLIAMAGDDIEMAENAFMMIHNAWGMAVGEKSDMRAMADVLEGIDGQLAQTYATRTGMAVEDVATLLDAETWLTAAQAVDAGFATSVSNSSTPSARFDLSGFRNAPRSAPQTGTNVKVPPKSRRDLECVLTQDAGYTRSQARAAMTALGISTATQDAGGDGLTQDADPAFVTALVQLRDSLTISE